MPLYPNLLCVYRLMWSFHNYVWPLQAYVIEPETHEA